MTQQPTATPQAADAPLPLAGIKVIDFTGVQAGPVCTQLMALFGAEVLKIERVKGGDNTRHQLRDVPGADALYYTMMNGNKRSLAIDTKTPEGLAIMDNLIRDYDVFVENMAPDALDHMGLTWEHIHATNPRMIYAQAKGFPPGSDWEHVKAYENVAQCAGGAASTTGFWDGPPTISAAALGDSNTGIHLLIGVLTALLHREKTGLGQHVTMSMQEAVLNLTRVKLRDQQRLERVGYLEEYPQYPNGTFTDVVPRGGNAGGGGQPGWTVKCKGWETDPNAYIYLTIMDSNWPNTAKAINHPEWAEDPEYATPRARQPKFFDILAEIEKVTADKDKYEAMKYFEPFGIPVAPVLSMKEIANDPELRRNGTIVEVDHPERGKYLTIGAPMKFSGFKPEVKRAPLLGEHSDEVLKEMGFDDATIADYHARGIIGDPSNAIK